MMYGGCLALLKNGEKVNANGSLFDDGHKVRA